MAMMEYDSVRRFHHHNSFDVPNYHYENRDNHIPLSYETSGSSRTYPIGRHVRSRAGIEKDELQGLNMENGPARRRIAVACARCRKRKIRCSGDRGDGLGCTNCRQAGIDSSQCLFHRVGSDNVAKVMDNYQMTRSLAGLAVTHSMLPVYSVSGESMLYPRTIPAYQYPQSDAKPVYPSGWSNPYSEDSPAETFNLDQPSTYLPTSVLTTTTTNVYETPSRWSLPTTRPTKYDASTYCDPEPSYVTQSLPHSQTDNRVPTTSDIVSPLNMSSLQANLPEKSPVQRVQVPETATPQRQLPMPQPSPALTARNVVDRMQDQRLRAAQVGNGQQIISNTFVKPLLPWAADGSIRALVVSQPVSMPTTTHSTTVAPVPSTSECNLVYTSASDTVPNYGSTTDAASQSQLDFSTSIPFDVMSMPPSTITYSNFRDYRGSISSSTQPQRPSSRSSTCVVKSDTSPKRNQVSIDSANSYPVASENQRTSPTRPHSTGVVPFRIPCRGVHEGKHVPFQRSPTSTVKSNL